MQGMERSVSALLPGRVGLVVRLPGNPGSRPALLDALHQYADRLDEEPGTEGFVIALDPINTDVVWLEEWFHDDDAMEAHRAAPAFSDLVAAMTPLLSDSAGILRLDPLRVHLSGGLVTAMEGEGLS
jgi:quinol monooxygenase YgiN